MLHCVNLLPHSSSWPPQPTLKTTTKTGGLAGGKPAPSKTDTKNPKNKGPGGAKPKGKGAPKPRGRGKGKGKP